MDHQPFETWLLEEEELTVEQRAELAAHLSICSQCLEMQNGLAATSALLLTARLVPPEPGFTQRWKETLAQRLELKNRLQTRRFFLTVLIGALISLGGLVGVLSLTNFSITDILVPVAAFIAGLFSFADNAQVLLGLNISAPVSVVLWIMATGSVCLLVFGWVYALWRFSSRGVDRNEKSI